MPAPGALGPVADLSASWIPVLLDAALKGTVLLVLAAAAVRVMDRASAAARHLVRAAALLGMLALPVLGPLAPAVEVPLLPEIELPPRPPGAAAAAPGPASGGTPGAGPLRVSAPTDPAGAPGDASPPARGRSDADDGGPAARAPAWIVRTDPLPLLGGLWLAGALLVLAGLLVGKVRIRWLARDAERVTDGPWVEMRERISARLGLSRKVVLLRAPRPLVPMTWGVVRPRVMLPEAADGWSDASRRSVLLHELAHVRRHDCLVRLLARLTCALYWFHPLVWHAARQLRLEQEEACDDHVLRAGILASDYARQLVDMARRLRAVKTPAHAGSTGVGRSDFMRRMGALLDGRRVRRPLSRRGAAALASAAGLLVLAVAAARPAGGADDAPGTGRAPGAADGNRPATERAAEQTADAVGPAAVGEAAGLELAAVLVSPPAVRAAPSGPGEPAGDGGAARGETEGRGAAPSDHRPGPTGPAGRDDAGAGVGAAAVSAAGPTGATPGADPNGGPVAPATVAPGDEAERPLRSAFAAFWHSEGGGPATGSAAEARPAGRGGFTPVTTAARALTRELAGAEGIGARAALLRRTVGQGSTRSLAVLMELSFRARRPADRLGAVRVLAEAPSGARARCLYQVARTNPWPEVREEAARQLGRLGPERVVPWLVTLVYGERDPSVQRRAVTELASLSRGGVDASLRQIARSHPVSEVRLEAIIWLLRRGSGEALARYVENA